jgi:hypothetical protein
MKKSHDVTCGFDRVRGCPFEFEYQHRLIAHPTRPTQDGFNRGVDRLHNPEADPMIAVRRDPLDTPRRSISGSRCHRSASIQPFRKFKTPVRVL